MKSKRSKALTLACLTATASLLSACAGAAVIPASLKAPCESTVGDMTEAQTIGDLSGAVIAGDGDLRLCSLKKQAVIEIAESQRRRWWQLF